MLYEVITLEYPNSFRTHQGAAQRVHGAPALLPRISFAGKIPVLFRHCLCILKGPFMVDHIPVKNLPQDTGWVEVVCGSMFSGKTEELIRRLRRAQIAKQP